MTPDEKIRADAINASIDELIKAKHRNSADVTSPNSDSFPKVTKAPSSPQNNGLTTDTKILLYAIAGELVYIASVRILVACHTGGPIEKEIYWTLLRLASLVFLWRLLGKYHAPGRAKSGIVSTALISCLALCAPILVCEIGDPIKVANVFAATSLVVGFREEFFYRGILQNYLRTKLRLPLTLLTSNTLFLFYHYGVQPFTPENMLMIVFAGLVFGLVYELTGSLVLAALLHGAYDIVVAYSPYITRPFSGYIGVLVLFLTGLILAAVNCRRLTAKQQSG